MSGAMMPSDGQGAPPALSQLGSAMMPQASAQAAPGAIPPLMQYALALRQQQMAAGKPAIQPLGGASGVNTPGISPINQFAFNIADPSSGTQVNPIANNL
jgi:hypothetical protein